MQSVVTCPLYISSFSSSSVVERAPTQRSILMEGCDATHNWNQHKEYGQTCLLQACDMSTETANACKSRFLPHWQSPLDCVKE